MFRPYFGLFRASGHAGVEASGATMSMSSMSAAALGEMYRMAAMLSLVPEASVSALTG